MMLEVDFIHQPVIINLDHDLIYQIIMNLNHYKSFLESGMCLRAFLLKHLTSKTRKNAHRVNFFIAEC